MSASLLFVCLGNICRSPTVEGVFRYLAAGRFDALIDSAGTAGYHIGRAPDRRAQQAALRRGVDLGGLRARQVCGEDFRRFDLILAMDRTNLAELRARQPNGSNARVDLFLDYAGYAGELEVPDPYYGGAEGFEQVLDIAFAASASLLAKLC